MSRLLYEKSVSFQGHLIIPFIRIITDIQAIYSYKLLSELGHKGKFHKLENPAEVYVNSVDRIIEVAKEHLEENSDVVSNIDYFQSRYTYRHSLIIIHEGAEKYFYDHYKPQELDNIAAPKIFNSEQECINWIKQGLNHDFPRVTQQEH
jgi:hypothetical protein